jgi:mannonate dehydratase
MKCMQENWRWFGPSDPTTLSDIKQAGAEGVVTALHHLPNGSVWPVEAIMRRKAQIEAAGLKWEVVESLPVTEAIKLQRGPWEQQIEHYQKSLLNLARCGIRTVTYNFMPVLDWTRTHLHYPLSSGAQALGFESNALAAFDLFIAQRKNAAEDYSPPTLQRAEACYQRMNEQERESLASAILSGLPGAEETYTLAAFRAAVNQYQDIGQAKLRQHLADFIGAVAPVAQEAGLRLAIHPDDPPFQLFGLPRIVSTEEDLRFILNASNLTANGLCFCTGSLGSSDDNDVPAMARRFAHHIHFVHLRNVQLNNQGGFFESPHLAGSVDMYAVVKTLLQEQQKRGGPIPFRPDHGMKMLSDFERPARPGYTAIGRLKGLAELRGLQLGISRSMAE